MAPKKKSIVREEDNADLRRKSSTSLPINSKSFLHGRLVDFSFLEKENFKIGSLLKHQGWEKILSTKKPIYPELIKEFYSNITFNYGTIYTSVKKTPIELNSTTLGKALGIPSDGILEVLPSQRDYKVSLILNIDDEDASRIDVLDANMLSVKNRLFHSIVSRILLPRAGSFNVVNDRDISVMYDILIEDPVDLPELMINVMQESLNRPKASLPYGMLLSYVFEFFNIKLKGETATGLRHSDIYNAHSLHRMDFAKKDGVWLKIRSRSGQSCMPPPAPVNPSEPPPNTFFNFDFNLPNPYLTAMTADPNIFPSDPPIYNPPSSPLPSYNFVPNPSSASSSSSALPTVRLCDDQIQHIIRQLTIATSSKSSGDSASSVNDQTLVPHISSVFEAISRFQITLAQLSHDIGILKGRVFHHNESVMDKILTEINLLKAKMETFETKADWVEHRVRSNENQTREALSAVAQWNASLAELSNLVKAQIGLAAASDPGVSYSHPHLFDPASMHAPVKSEPSDAVHISSSESDSE